MNDPITEAMTDNEALVGILSEVRTVRDRLIKPYDDVSGVNNVPVNTVYSVARAANARAVQTIVTNTGANPVRVREDAHLVRIIAPDESVTLPLQGAGEITCRTEDGTSEVYVTTYVKNDD